MFLAKLTILFFSATIANCEFSVEFLKDYYNQRKINEIVWFACLENSDKIEYMKQLYDAHFRVSYLDIKNDFKMKDILQVHYRKIGVILDFNCPQSDVILNKFSDEGLRYNDSYNWLILSMDMYNLSNSLKNRPLNIASELTIANMQSNMTDLYDVYNPSHRHGSKINITFMGKWAKNVGLDIVLSDYKYLRRADLHGLKLNFSIFVSHQPKNVDLEDYLRIPMKKHLDTMIRYNYGLLLKLKDLYNYNFRYIKTDTWGYQINGTFNGGIGDMIKGIVDVSIPAILIRQERLDVCEFTVQSYLMRGAIFLRHPKKSSIRNVFLMPFTTSAWFVIVIAGLVYWTFLCIILVIENRQFIQKMNTTSSKPFPDAVFSTVAALSQQGLSEIPRLNSGRIICLSLLIWGLLLFQFYSASIVGSLLAEPPRFINTLKDLAKSDLQVGINDVAYIHNYFRITNDPDVLELYRLKIKANEKRKKASFFNVSEGLAKVKAGGFAFYCQAATGYKIIQETFNEDEICDLVELQLHPPRDIGTVLQRHSPFKKMFTYGLRKILESGTSQRLYQRWHYQRTKCPESHSSTPLPVQLQESTPALFLLLIGIGFAAMILIFEIVYQKHLH